MPPGTGDAYLTVAKDLKPDSAILVTTESPLAVQDTLKSKILFEKLNITILGYINNMVSSSSSGTGTENDITNILGLDLLGSIPMDNAVADFNLIESTKLFESTYNNLKIII